MSQVRILRGEYHDKPVSGVFDLVKPYKEGKRGGFITIQNDGSTAFANGGLVCRVRVDRSSDFEYIGEQQPHRAVAGAIAFTPADTVSVEPQPQESDEDAMNRIATRFQILDEMSKACISGDIRSLIVTGPPGVGKSFGVHRNMEAATLFDTLAGRKLRYEIVKGTMSAIGLFALLYKYSDRKNVLIFDDCDIWEDQDAVNILKGALDSGKTRRISYNKDSRLLREEGVPNSFDFHGSIIFITNKTFGNKRASKIQPHLDALQSRSHFLDLTINTERDAMIRIKQVHRDASANEVGGLFADYEFENDEDTQILDFMWANKDKLREISLRSALKIADLVKISPDRWKMLAESTCMRNA